MLLKLIEITSKLFHMKKLTNSLATLLILFMCSTLIAQQLEVINPSGATIPAAKIQNGAEEIALEVDNGNSMTTEPAVKIINAGIGEGLDIRNTGSTSLDPAALIVNSGKGHGLHSRNVNATTTSPAILGESAGTSAGVGGINTSTGPGVRGLKSGTQTGHAGLFQNINPLNPTATLLGTSNGLGPAIEAENTAAAPSLNSVKLGAATGQAGIFENFNAANANEALLAKTNGTGPALLGESTGAGPSIIGNKSAAAFGPAGEFTNMNPANGSAALSALSLGTSASIEAVQFGTAPSYVGLKMGAATGSVSLFNNSNPLNIDPVVQIINIGKALPSLGLLVEGNVHIQENLSTKHENINNTDLMRPAVVVDNFASTHFGILINQKKDSLFGLSPALSANQFALGNAGEFVIHEILNGADAVFAKTAGDGSAGSFLATDSFSSTSALIGIHNGSGHGVEGQNNGFGHGVVGLKPAASGSLGNAGFFHIENSSNPSAAVKIIHADSSATALDVDGNVFFSGDLVADDIIANTLTAGAKFFRIDHPLEPKNKFLQHTSIESYEMMNLYTGNVILDKKGKAIVEMPEWFEALNTNLKYHLTCIGGYAKVYISKEMENGKFEIAGGKKGMKISWQVTGTRHDTFARENPLQVELGK